MKLAAACERALVASARRERSASRQQLRAAARRFVRRHRRDAGYLGWVLRSVGASSALAVALLGLGAAPAEARLAPFAAFPQNLQPGHDIGSYSSASMGDLDADGDIDAIAGAYPLGIFLYLENTRHAGQPSFVVRTGAANPLTGQDVGVWSIPELGDLDADGDLDLLSGESSGVFFYFENTGSARVPAFAPRTGAANPMNGVDTGTDSFPTFGDLDADGDLDLVVGEDSGTFRYFENTGNAKTPAFVPRTGTANPLNGFDVGLVATPELGDVDDDGDLDLVSGEADYGNFLYFENTGTATLPAFVARTGTLDNPLNFNDVSSLSTPALGDLDADGDLDLMAGERYGTFVLFDHRANALVLRAEPGNPLTGVDAGLDAAPALGDLDADGDLDLLSGELLGTLVFFRNTGSQFLPGYVMEFGGAETVFTSDFGSYSTPAIADLDADGDPDLAVGSSTGTVFGFTNVGGPVSPLFTAPAGPGVGLGSIDVGNESRPEFVDLDFDADFDLVVGNLNGELFYFENIGNSFFFNYVARTGFDNPFAGLSVVAHTGHADPAFGDVDRDGDLDLLVGAFNGTQHFYVNAGTWTDPHFVPVSGAVNPVGTVNVGGAASPAFGHLNGDDALDLVIGASNGGVFYLESYVLGPPEASLLSGTANPLNGHDVGTLAGPALADLDRDGDADLLAGENGGTFRYFENTGSAVGPRFAARTGAANPLNGRDVGDEARPAFADLDGDGDFDLLAGRLAGDFSYFQNTGNARTPAFAAPVANPFGLALTDAHSAPAFGDLDADGDLDLAVGSYFDTEQWFENTGSRTSPAFVLRFNSANPFDPLFPAYYSMPALADFDGDGDLDLVRGGEHGRFAYVENVSGARDPGFFLPSIANFDPLQGSDVGERAAPAAADLNGDGTPDLVTGNLDGTFAVHFVPEPARGTLLGAGIALLAWLRGRRR